MVRKQILARIDIDFIDNLRKAYPEKKSNRERTKALNQKLEEMLYGKKKK